jgi:aminobenzoyl-glutamate utilization protein B
MRVNLRWATALVLVVVLALLTPAGKAAENGKKDEAAASIEKHQAELIKLSDQIWSYAETALREHKSAKALADYAEQQGFKV